MNGERIIIAKAGRPMAVLMPIETPVERRIPGDDAGKVIIAENFDAPLPEFN
jgi:antitoxin (DNA-binding transcriptional repressor) of toxin-antitoxin stability system